MDKETFLFKDRILKAVTSDSSFKISVVKTTDVVAEARQRHHLSLLNTVILGRALTGVMLLASELKGEERVQLRIEGDGPIGILVAEANCAGEIRGYVQHPDAELDYSDTDKLGEGLGRGTLSFSKVLYNEAKPLTGVVSLQSGTISDDLAHYLMQSEQVPSAISLDVQLDKNGEVKESAGILIQAMPDAPGGMIDKLQQNLAGTSPLGIQLSNGRYIDEILDSIIQPYSFKELDRYPVHFYCRCSKNRFMDALSLVSLEDLSSFDDEGQELICHYCNEHYYVTREEIRDIINKTKIRMN